MPNHSHFKQVSTVRFTLADWFPPTASLSFFFGIRFATMLAIVLFAAGAMPVKAQSSSDEVAKLQKKLAAFNETMKSLKEKLDAGEGNLDSMQQDYTDALIDANEVISSLHDACLDAVEKDPSDQSNVRTVMGILLNEADAGRDGKVLRSCDRLIKAGVSKAYFNYAAQAERISIEAREIFDEVLVRQREHKANDLPQVMLKTNKGDITVELYENEAPQTVGNFISLVESGFYSRSLFHRVIDGFMAQAGGPKKNNEGDDDPGYLIYDEHKNPDTRPHFTGVLSMANTGATNSGSSQFFITFGRTTFLDGRHTVFGRVIDGHGVVDRIVRTHTDTSGRGETPVPNASPDYIKSATVIRKRNHKYRPRKVGEPEEVDEPELPPVTQESTSFDDNDVSKEEMKETSEDESDDGEETKPESEESKPDHEKTVTEEKTGDKDSTGDQPDATADKTGDDDAETSEQTDVESDKNEEPSDS